MTCFGTVIFFTKGYGFIKYEIDGIDQPDIFVYYLDITSDLEFKQLYSYQKVSFDVMNYEKNGKALQKAINVKVLS